MRVLWAIVMASILLAGCTTDTAPAPEDGDHHVEGRPDTSYGEVETGPAAQPDLNATTAAAPKLIEGEWWRIRYANPVFDELVEVVRVVANATDEGYIMGMPHEGWLKEAISFHSPSFGNVGLDLSYPTHNQMFAPVQFPLEEGNTWTTSFVATEYVATVESADTYTATIRYTPSNADDPDAQVGNLVFGLGDGSIVMEYDARQHEIVRMEGGIGTWEVVEHGYGFEGWVTVPHGEDTAIDYGRIGPASPDHDIREQTLSVEGDFNRMTMMHFVGTAGPTPGTLELRHTTPEGEEWLTTYSGTESTIAFYETNQPNGEWTVQDTIAGGGFTYSMGIAYLQYDILLPDGTQRTDHGHGVVR